MVASKHQWLFLNTLHTAGSVRKLVAFYVDRHKTRVLRSRTEPMKKVARSFRSHRELLLNWFQAKGGLSSGIVEGFNNKAKVTMRKAYGFRTVEGLQVAL